jgi:hypothetical protein
MIGIEIAVGYLASWAVRKANRVGRKVDETADEVIDRYLERLHDVVVAGVGGDRSLERLEAEAAATGRVEDRTRRWVQLVLEDAVKQDSKFAESLLRAVRDTQSSHAADAGNHAAGRSVTISGDVVGIVSVGDSATIIQRQ